MSGSEKPDIRSLSADELKSFFLENGEKPFRSAQISEWLWKKNSPSLGEMSNVPKSLRDLLSASFTYHKAVPHTIRSGSDGTVKILFRLHDDSMVEGVLIPSGKRFTACVSSQVGCALSCSFCATGMLGFTRNLEPGEIYDQAAILDQMAMERNGSESGLSNIVYMGMGEPLLNYPNVKRSVEMLVSADGMGVSPQRITISSLGIPKMIRKLADDRINCHFALSLHSASEEKRNRLAPNTLNHPLVELKEALRYYHSETGKRFTIEYILFRDVNDSLYDAAELAKFCRNFPVKVNLLEYNVVEGSGLSRSSRERTQAFAGFLESKNMVVNIRKSRGREIEAACGQLAGSHAAGIDQAGLQNK